MRLSNFVSIFNDYVIQNKTINVGNISKPRILLISIDSISFETPSVGILVARLARLARPLRFGKPKLIYSFTKLGSVSSTEVPVLIIGGMIAYIQFCIVFLS